MKVGIAGPLLGGHPGWVVSQGERLAAHLAAEDVEVHTTSDRIGRWARAANTRRSIRDWRGEVDVVVVMVFSGPAFAMADLTTRSVGALGVPIVMWLHGGNLPSFAHRHPRWVRTVLARADLIVAPSPYLATLFPLAGQRQLEAPATTIIPNAIGAPGPRPLERTRRPRLLWMRTFHPLYEPGRAVEVLSAVRASHPDASLTMAGQDRGGLPEVVALADRLGLSEAVHFPGFLDEEGKRHAFGAHDIFLNTSVVDNAPVSLLEAAAHGLPLVTTPAGGIPDLFPRQEAALYGHTAAELAAQVSRLVDEPALAHRIALRAYERALDSTWARVGPRWQDALREVIGRG